MTSNKSISKRLVYLCLIVGIVLSFNIGSMDKDIEQNNHIVSQINAPQNNQQNDDCTTPQIFEYINGFTLPLKDVSKLLSNQFSRNDLSNINAADKVTLYNIKYASKLLTNNQSQSYQTPLKALVVNDQAQFTFTYQINITEGIVPKTKTFNASTVVKGISFSYEKQMKLQTQSSTINSVTVSFKPEMMNSTFSPSPDGKQTTKFDNAIKGNSASLYDTFNKLISSQQQIKQYMQTNCNGEHISRIYDSKTYNYAYYDFKFDVDVSSLNISTQKVDTTTNLMNGMAGKLPTNPFCSQFTPNFTTSGGANMFITTQFVQNFVQHTKNTNPAWKNIRIDRKTVRSPLLQFYLLDLQFITDGLWTDLSQFYQNQIYFTCSILNNVATQVNPGKNQLYQTLDWKCAGYVIIDANTTVQVMDFVPQIMHTADLSASSYLGVVVNSLETVDVKWNEVPNKSGTGKYTIKDDKLARRYIESVFNDMRVWTVGTYFKINPSSTTIKGENNQKGFWIL